MDNQDYELKIQKGDFLSFRPENNASTMIVVTEALLKKAMALEEDVVAEQESFSLNNGLSKYVFLGIDPVKQLLKIKKQGL